MASYPNTLLQKILLWRLPAKSARQAAQAYVIEYTGSAIRDLVYGRPNDARAIWLLKPEPGPDWWLPMRKPTHISKAANLRLPVEYWDQALAYWKSLPSDEGAVFDATVTLNAADIAPQVSWGTSPEQVVGVDGCVPAPESFTDEIKRNACESALDYMGLTANTKITDIPVDLVFIGSCTNGRIEDFRIAAEVAKGTHVAKGVTAIAVPGSYHVKQQAEDEGLDKIFIDAGWEWRDPGCSMCLAMNGDELTKGQRSASTSNRNFEGRQGKGGRTHLVSPAMAAAAAAAGHFVDIRNL